MKSNQLLSTVVFLLAGLIALIRPPGSVSAQTLSAQTFTAQQQLAHDIYKELVEINTVTATGDTGKAADAMAARLRAAGFAGSDVQVFKPVPGKGNLVARLHGSGARKPILLLAHLDVVEARREDWSFDPFQLLEKDGYYYGARHPGRQIHGRHVCFKPDSLQTRRVQARSRHHPGPGDRRRNSRPQRCGHSMADQEPSRFD